MVFTEDTVMFMVKVLVPMGMLLVLYFCVCKSTDSRSSSSSSTARVANDQPQLDPVSDEYFDEKNMDELRLQIVSQLIVRQVISCKSSILSSSSAGEKKEPSWQQWWPFQNIKPHNDGNTNHEDKTNAASLSKSETLRYKNHLTFSDLPLRHSRKCKSSNDLISMHAEHVRAVTGEAEIPLGSASPGLLSNDTEMGVGAKNDDTLLEKGITFVTNDGATTSSGLTVVDPIESGCPCKLNFSCEICLGEYQVGDHVAWSHNASCVHGFHKECIVDWLQRSKNCPLCRQEYITCNSSSPSSL